MKKPTINDLERLIADEESKPFEIMPNGEIRITDTPGKKPFVLSAGRPPGDNY